MSQVQKAPTRAGLTTSHITTAELRRHAERLPRIELAHLPTPLEELPRFSQALGGPRVFIKRDDCTGLAFGGNKTRHNEFILAHALQQGAELLVWGAGVQSNNCRQTAASCARLGLDCHLVLSRASHCDDVQGNLLLDHLLGATIEVVDIPIGPDLFAYIAQVAARHMAAGRKAYYWNDEVIKPRAAVSYALCLAELADQCAELEIEPAAVYVSSAGSTGAGLVLAKALLGWAPAVRIVAPIRWPWDHAHDLAKTGEAAARLLGLDLQIEAADVDTTDGYIGPGYGIATPNGLEALNLLARTEGILLDPVYTAKCMAALMADVRQGRFSADKPVVFLHTGGTPALFAYRDELIG